ncbi:MAG TPA: serine/threonine-protein kinase, partial [Nannocystaceae bacterium]|nr:serine/threonine-protein kinase [Nannocystaceae bacterium]
MSIAGGDAADSAVIGLPAAEVQMRDRLRASLFGTPCEPVRRGRYVVLGVLGRGGLGVVHAAYDPELDRKVALKVVDAHALGSADLRARLRREAQALARLSHPNVVAVHDVGFDGDELYVAMALVEGRTLGAWLHEAEPTWSEIRDVLVGVARGLAAAHRVGIVHRDVKPANVIVDREGRPHVLDFGLARAVGGADAASDVGDPSSGTTAVGALLGTPPYMAPEQLDGGTIDARTDQWGLCVTAYECLFGARPFVADSIAALRVRVRQPPDPPGRAVPRWLQRAIERGLQPDPAARHADMDALVRAFERDRHSRRRQWFAIGGALVLAAASAAIAATVVAARPDPELLASIERLAHEARAAAGARHFVHPAPDASQQATALQAIVALEGLDDDDAHARALTLREEFAAELTALGDAYWALPDGRGYAADFYAASLMFVPDQPDARARALQTDGQLAVLRDKATRGAFSEPELESAEVLAELAAADVAAPEPTLRRVQGSLAQRERISFLARPHSIAPTTTRPASEPPSPTPTAAPTPTPAAPVAAPTSADRRSR